MDSRTGQNDQQWQHKPPQPAIHFDHAPSTTLEQLTDSIDSIMLGLNARAGGPGHMGVAAYASPDQSTHVEDSFKKHQFNVIVSDMISLNRSLLDYRPKQ